MLADASAGMVVEAEARLGSDRRFEFRLAEISRVLRAHGTLRRYEDSLDVTEVRPLVDYLLSGSAADSAVRASNADEFGLKVSDLIERPEQELASRGAIHITKDVGMFVASK